jgi:hypothetical protein
MPKGRPLVRLGDPWQHTPLNTESEAAMTASSQTPSTAPTVFIDRDGDTWIPNGTDSAGELRLVCPEPAEPGDQGDGESYPWTLRMVEVAFGPLTERSAVSA